VALVFCLLAPLLMAGESAAKLYERGRQAEMDGHLAEAYQLYSQAAALEPGNRMYWVRSLALRNRTAAASKSAPPPAPAAPAKSALASITGSLTPQDLAEASRPQPPRSVKATPGRKALDFRGDARSLFEQVAHAYSLETVFDGEYPASGPVFRFQLQEADYLEAFRALEAATSSFVAPLSERLLIVAKDTPQKRLQVEPLAAVTIAIPEPVSLQDAQELARSVQQTCDIRRLLVDSSRRQVFIRDSVSKVRVAENLFAQTLHHRPEVVIEVLFMEVSHSSTLNYGFNLPTSIPLVYFGGVMKSTAQTLTGFTTYATFGGGAALFGLGTATAEAIANLSQSDGYNLQQTQIRTIDGQVANLHIGDKYPVTTGFYTTGSGSGTTTSTAATASAGVNYEDLGIVLKLTPHIHGTGETTLETEAEYKVLSGDSSDGIPVIANRKFQCQVRLRTGEWAVLSGLVTSSDSRSLSGITGLASLPLLGHLFRQHTKARDKSEMLLLVRPVLLSLPPSEKPQPALWVGSEARLSTPL
jgi:general secretion pathway protein D